MTVDGVWPAVQGIAYGGDYTPEQWPRETWHDDVALMREAGVLNCEKRGLNIYYSLACDCLADFLRCVDKLACGGKKTTCC